MRKETKFKLLSWLIILAALGLVVLYTWIEGISFATISIWSMWGMIFVCALLDTNLPFVIMMYSEIGKLAPILMSENNPDKYIRELDYLLGKTKSKRFQQVHLMNTSAAYTVKRDFAKAKELLLEADVNKMVQGDRVIYWSNLAELHFILDETEEAMHIMNLRRKEFYECRENKNVGNTIATLEIYWSINTGNIEEAHKLLKEARAKWETPINKLGFDLVEQRLEERK